MMWQMRGKWKGSFYRRDPRQVSGGWVIRCYVNCSLACELIRWSEPLFYPKLTTQRGAESNKIEIRDITPLQIIILREKCCNKNSYRRRLANTICFSLRSGKLQHTGITLSPKSPKVCGDHDPPPGHAPGDRQTDKRPMFATAARPGDSAPAHQVCLCVCLCVFISALIAARSVEGGGGTFTLLRTPPPALCNTRFRRAVGYEEGVRYASQKLRPASAEGDWRGLNAYSLHKIK